MCIDDVRLAAGERGDVMPPGLVKELIDDLLWSVGVIDFSFVCMELKEGVFRRRSLAVCPACR